MITVDGAQQVAESFEIVAGLAAEWLGDAVHDGGQLVADKARELVRKRRPQLGPSITSEMIDPLTAEIGPENALGGGYGHILEKGLAGRAPQPYLGPALDTVENQVLDRFDTALRNIL
jgi:hypothetical protein